MKFKILLIFLFVIVYVSTNAQNKRYIGRVDGKKLYLYEDFHYSMHHDLYTWILLSDTNITNKDLKSITELNSNDSCYNANKNKIFQILASSAGEKQLMVVDENIIFDKVVLNTKYEFESPSSKKKSEYSLIIPAKFYDIDLGVDGYYITYVFEWDKESRQFRLKDQMVTGSEFNQKISEIQNLLSKGEYTFALQKVKQKDFYEISDPYPGYDTYLYPQNLFLDFLDYTHKYALESLIRGDTVNAANLTNSILYKPLFIYNEKDGYCFPFLTSTDFFHQHNVNITTQSNFQSVVDTARKLEKLGYIIYDNHSPVNLNYSDSKFPCYQFIPNDPEYTTKVNDFAYFLQLGPYDSLAVVLLKQIIYHHPERTVAYLNMADALYDLGEKTNAKKYYLQYANLCKKNKIELKIPERVLQRMKL